MLHFRKTAKIACSSFSVETKEEVSVNNDDPWCVYPQGNMQRCKLVMDQVTEARDTMMKVLDHKEKVLKLLNKNGAVKKSSKLKRKERA